MQLDARHDLQAAKAQALASLGELLDYLDVARTDMPAPEDVGDPVEYVDPEDACPPVAPGLLAQD